MADETGATPDTGTPGSTPTDATPLADTGTPPVDTGTPPTDTGTQPAESATPPADPDAPPPPKDWAQMRQDYAKGDEKLLKRLSRYSSPEAVMDALVAAQNKIASGALKTALPEKPTPEQLTAWREENGIPATPEEYDVDNLPDGRVLGDLDRPVVEGYLKTAHEMNLPPEAVKQTVSYFLQHQENMVAARHAADEEARINGTIELRQEWGPEFQLNRNLITGMLDSAPSGVKDQLMQARGPDGTPLMSSPATLRWLANLAREVNPVATVSGATGTNAAQAVESEMAGLVGMMGDRASAYWKGPMAEKHQARYRELVTLQEKLKR